MPEKSSNVLTRRTGRSGARASSSGRSSRVRGRRRAKQQASTGAVSLSRRKVPRRYRDSFSPESPLSRTVEYIPYRHAVSEAKRRLQRTPVAYLALAVIWIVVGSLELVRGSPSQPVLLGAAVVSFVGFAIWNVYTLLRMRKGHPSGSVWRYGLFLWPDALVVLPADGPAIIVPIDAIESVQVGKDSEPTPSGTSTSRVVRVTATGDDGELVAVTIDDLGAMPAPHLVRTLETWRTGVDPELLAAAPTAGTAVNRRVNR